MSTQPRRGFRRRLDTQVLRWQARLDAAWADRVVAWLFAVVLGVVWFLLAYAQSRSLESGSALAAYKQAAWLIAHGHAPDVTITGQHLLADGFPLAFYPLGLVSRWVPTVPLLLAVQAAGLAFGVVPLWRLARTVAGLRVGATAALCTAYGLYPALNGIDLADFHPEALAVAPLLAATYEGMRGRWWRFTIWSTLAVLFDADFGLLIAGLGVLFILEGHGRQGTRAVGLGVLWTVLAVALFENNFGSGGLGAAGAFEEYGSSFFGILGTMLVHPLRVLGDLFAEPNLRMVMVLFAPLLFLPLLAPRYLLAAVPLQALYLVADVPITASSGAPYTVPLVVFSFVAATFALQRMGRRSIERVLVDRRLLVALLLAATGFFAVESGSSPYRHPWDWGRQDVADRARLDAVDLVPDGHDVRASAPLLQLLAERPGVYQLPGGERPVSAREATRDVDWLIVDASTTRRWSVPDRLAFEGDLTAVDFDPVFRAQGITVYKRMSR